MPLDALAQLLQPFAGERRDQHRAAVAEFHSWRSSRSAGRSVEDEEAWLFPRPILGTSSTACMSAIRRFRLRGVDDVDDQIGQRRLLERRLERLDQLMGSFSMKPTVSVSR